MDASAPNKRNSVAQGRGVGLAAGLPDNERVAVHSIVINTESFQLIHCFKRIVRFKHQLVISVVA